MGPVLDKWLQKLQAICVDKEAIVDLTRLVVALALFPAPIATKVFLRVYFFSSLSLSLILVRFISARCKRGIHLGTK